MASVAQPLVLGSAHRWSAPVSEPAPADERSLAQRAAAGDGDAFAVLYERYEQRTYNL